MKRLIQRIIDLIRGKRPDKPEPAPPEFPAPLVWLDMDISDWPVTTDLRPHVSGGVLYLDNDKSTTWPNVFEARGGGWINATAWVIVERNGTWYAATWEHLRTGQHNKQAAWLKAGDQDTPPGQRHIPHRVMEGWVPQSGETIYHMVSTTARYKVGKLKERSNAVRMVWP